MRISPRIVVRVVCLGGPALIVLAIILVRTPLLERWAIHRLRHDDWNVRRDAVEACGRLRSANAVPYLLELWLREVDFSLDDEEAVTTVTPREVAESGLQKERTNTIIAALQRIGANAVPALVRALDDQQRPRLRYVAAVALGQLKGAAGLALQPLEATLRDEEPLIRSAALVALDAMGPLGRAAVLSVLQSEDDALVFQALNLVLPIRDPSLSVSPETARAVEEMLASRRPETSRYVFGVVQSHYATREPPRVYYEYIRRVMKDGPAHVPHSAAAELVRRLGPEAIPDLVDFGETHQQAGWHEAWTPFLSVCPVVSRLADRARAERNVAHRLEASRRALPARVLSRAVSWPGPDGTPEMPGPLRSKVIEALRRALDARLYNARYAALDALRRFVPESPVALEILHSAVDRPELREMAIDILVATDPAVRVNVAARLRAALEARDVPGFFLAARLAPEVESRRGDVVQTLLRALDVRELDAAAVSALQTISRTPGWETAATDFLEVASEASLPYLRGMATRAVPALIDALSHPKRVVRLGAVELLSELGPGVAAAAPALLKASAVPALIEALGHEERAIRLAALELINQLGPDAAAAVPVLLARLDDPDRTIRANMARALGLIGAPSERAVSRLESMWRDDPDRWVRQSAGTALDHINASLRAAESAPEEVDEAESELFEDAR